MRFRAPANVLLRRAQVILLLVALVPTILTTPIGIVLLVQGDSESVNLVAGVLVLAFCASSVSGFMVGALFLRRGASLVRVQNDFFAAVSHELRTPMTSMRIFIEALRDDRLTDPAQRQNCLAVLHDEMMRLDQLVGRLFDLSRIETVGQPYELVPTDVTRVVDRAVTAFDAINLGGDATLEVDVEPNLLVTGDQGSLTQALVNLLSNAWKYSGGDKQIRLNAKAAGEREVEIVICDNGPGIPPDEQRRVFEKFERGSAAADSGVSGSGLGLAIAQGIVKAHRGRIELRSEPGEGACFHVFVPRWTGRSRQAGR